MDFSSLYRSTNGSLPSPNGTFLSNLTGSRLMIRDAHSLQIKRIINLNPDFAQRISFMKWSPQVMNELCVGWNGLSLGKRRSGIDKTEEEGGAPLRLLVADEETIQVYDMKDDKWTATINQGFGGIRNVDFGRNQDEVIVFADYQLKITVWSLVNSKHIEIPNPKFSTNVGYGYRPCTSHFALLCRQSTHDVITVHNHTNYRLASTWTLPTLDAQGLKWAPCGRWIAVWESAALGYKVLIYTSDGHLYRTYDRQCEGLGVKSVEWSPNSDFLTIGSYDGRMVFLSNYTFSPVIEMNHTSTIRLPGVSVWSECLTASRERHYSIVSQPMLLPTFPCHPSEVHQKLGISTIAFNRPDGHLVATKNDSMPTTVWIWSLKLLKPYTVLVHLTPVKSIQWHPTIPDLLMILCTNDDDRGSGVVYLWSSRWKQPRAVVTPIERVSGQFWAKWLYTPKPSNSATASNGTSGSSSTGSLVCDRRSRSPEKECDKKPTIIFGDRDGFAMGYVEDEIADETDIMGPIAEDDGYITEKRAWNPRDWAFSSPSQQQSPTPQSNYSYTINNGLSREGLGSVLEQSSSDNVGKSKKEDDDYRHRRHVSIKS
ncbi:hypothetical protein EV426DRAFT_291421 [Tirmania nivea]|nr:hypothetical protein EV426DRAFT_291421 [Tirmania nivea]